MPCRESPNSELIGGNLGPLDCLVPGWMPRGWKSDDWKGNEGCCEGYGRQLAAGHIGRRSFPSIPRRIDHVFTIVENPRGCSKLG